MKKAALILSFVAFFAFGTAGLQTVVAGNNVEITQTQDVKKKDDKKKKAKSSDCKEAKSCCKSEMKKEECNDKKADKK
jgi:hypothetical protein